MPQCPAISKISPSDITSTSVTGSNHIPSPTGKPVGASLYEEGGDLTNDGALWPRGRHLLLGRPVSREMLVPDPYTFRTDFMSFPRN